MRKFPSWHGGKFSNRRRTVNRSWRQSGDRRRKSCFMRRLHGESLEGRHLLAVITVDTLVDEMDGSIDDGDVSLRDAIGLASDRDTIDFATTLDGGTILLTQGELQITRLITIDASMLPNGLTIDASGNDPTPDNGDGSRIFNISDGDVGTDSPVTIRGLTLTSGDVDGYGGAVYSRESLTLTDSTISENSAGDGGAIYSDGDVTVTNSTISGNFGGGILAISVAVTDSTISGSFGRGISTIVSVAVTNSTILENFGGGIFTRGSVAVTDSMILDNGFQGIRALGDVTVTASTISRNSGSGIDANDVTVTASTISENSGRGGVIDGSGIDANGDVTVANSTISGNSGSGIRADGDGTVTNVTNSTISGNLGGGIYVFEAVTVTSSTISGNSTGFFRDGGGIYAGHDVTVNDSTISGNSATRRGGGIFSPTVAITNSTISENSTVRDGGGVYSSGVVTVTHSTISGNSAGSSGGGIHARLGYSARLVIENSIVAGNTAERQRPRHRLWKCGAGGRSLQSHWRQQRHRSK